MLTLLEAASLSIALTGALLLDQALGEPKKFHPLVGFGKLAKIAEQLFLKQGCHSNSNHKKLLLGCLAWGLLVTPLPVLIYYLQSLFIQSPWTILFDVFILYSAIGLKSLKQHAMLVFNPLMQNKLDEARHYCSFLVSRDTQQLSERDLSRAVTESVLENGHDAVVATLFWYLIGGAPFVILHRLANTMDAMWGYRSEKYLYFGRFSARMDDILGWPSARVTALLFAVQGNVFRSISNARRQACSYKSVNGGWSMASGATTLNIQLGGEAEYFGRKVYSPILGEGNTVSPIDITHSIALVTRSAWIFVVTIGVLSILSWALF